MHSLLFLSRLALFCNLFFALAVSLQISNWLPQADAVALILILGFALSALFNPAVNLLYFLVYILKRKNPVPLWLRLLNVFFLLLQIVYVLYLNEAHQQVKI